jgi:hypothetical protein
VWEETSEHRLDEPDPTVGDPHLPWRCAGHPLVELPHDIDGERVEAGNITELTQRSLAGWIPAGARPHDRERATWTIRLYVRLRGTLAGDAVAQAVAESLEDPQPRVRAMALNFIAFVREPIVMRKVLELLQGDRALFAGVPDEVTTKSRDKTLEDSLWRVAYTLVEKVESARALARREAVTPGRARPVVFSVLANRDAEWFVDHLGEVVHANPSMGDAILYSLEYALAEGMPYQSVMAKAKELIAKLPKPS